MASLDPFSGQEVYQAQSMGADMAIDSMQGLGVDAPLAFRMMEHIPGFATSAGFSTFRGSGTIMRGGFLDEGHSLLRSKRAAKYRVMQDGAVSARNPAQFMRGQRADGWVSKGFNKIGLQRPQGPLARRAARLASEGHHSGTLRSMRVNNVTVRPRALSRFHSLSVFGEGSYTPFSASKMLGNTSMVRDYFKKQGIDVAEGQSALGSGLFSFITAGRKADVLERRAMSGSTRALNKLHQLDNSISSLAKMNNPAFMASTLRYEGTAGLTYGKALGMTSLERGGLSASDYVSKNALRAVGGPSPYASSVLSRVDATQGPMVGGGVMGISGEVGVRGNMLASSMAGSGTRYMAGYFRGAQGFANAGGLFGEASTGALKAVGHFETALGKAGIKGTGSMLEGSVIRNLGGSGFMKTLATKEGAAVLGARGLAMAIPGLNILATASLVYDLGKMAGEVVKSGINLAKDATKSMKGTIYKPVFGMGYKDTEAAATSRARGVMAIQNSQLNARSALGNEAALMAAHFG